MSIITFQEQLERWLPQTFRLDGEGQRVTLDRMIVALEEIEAIRTGRIAVTPENLQQRLAATLLDPLAITTVLDEDSRNAILRIMKRDTLLPQEKNELLTLILLSKGWGLREDYMVLLFGEGEDSFERFGECVRRDPVLPQQYLFDARTRRGEGRRQFMLRMKPETHEDAGVVYADIISRDNDPRNQLCVISHGTAVGIAAFTKVLAQLIMREGY